MEVDWSSLHVNQCSATLELLLDSDDSENLSEYFERGITALLSHARLCHDLIQHNLYCNLIRDCAIISPGVVSIILNDLNNLPLPVPYINILPTILAAASSQTISNAVNTLKALLQQDSELLLPILGVICQISTSVEMVMTAQILMEDAINFISEEQLPELLKVMIKCAHVIDIKPIISKLRPVLFNINHSELFFIFEVLANSLQCNSKIMDAFISFIIDEIITETTLIIPSFFDTMVALILFSYELNNARSFSARRLLSYWLQSSLFPFEHMRVILQQGVAWKMFHSHILILLSWTIHAISSCSFSGLKASYMHIRHSSKCFVGDLSVHSDKVSQRSSSSDSSYFGEISKLLFELYTANTSLRDVICQTLTSLVFQSDKSPADADEFRSATDSPPPLPPLGEASLALLPRLDKKASKSYSFRTSHLCSKILFAICSLDSSMHAAVGSLLYSTLSNRLLPDHDGNIFLIPYQSFSTVLDILVISSQITGELESALLIMIQKLLGCTMNSSSSSSSMFASLLGSQSTSLLTSTSYSGVSSDKMRPQYNLRSVGVLIAHHVLTTSMVHPGKSSSSSVNKIPTSSIPNPTPSSRTIHATTNTSSEQRALLNWLLQAISSPIDETCVYVFDALRGMLLNQTFSGKESELKGVYSAFMKLFQPTGPLRTYNSTTAQLNRMSGALISKTNVDLSGDSLGIFCIDALYEPSSSTEYSSGVVFDIEIVATRLIQNYLCCERVNQNIIRNQIILVLHNLLSLYTSYGAIGCGNFAYNQVPNWVHSSLFSSQKDALIDYLDSGVLVSVLLSWNSALHASSICIQLQSILERFLLSSILLGQLQMIMSNNSEQISNSAVVVVCILSCQLRICREEIVHIMLLLVKAKTGKSNANIALMNEINWNIDIFGDVCVEVRRLLDQITLGIPICAISQALTRINNDVLKQRSECVLHACAAELFVSLALHISTTFGGSASRLETGSGESCPSVDDMFLAQCPFHSSISSCVLLASQLDVCISKISELRQTRQDGSDIDGDMDVYKPGTLTLSDSCNINLGCEVGYLGFVNHAILSYFILCNHIQCIQMHTASLEESFDRMNEDMFISTLANSMMMKRDSDLSSHNGCNVSLLYNIIEQHVKTTQDSKVALAGFKVLVQLSKNSCISSRVGSLSFLLSTLLFTNHTNITRLSKYAGYNICRMYTDFLSCSEFADTIYRKRNLRPKSDTSSMKLLLSALKYLDISTTILDDIQISAVFFLSWWLLESPKQQLEGLALLLMDCLYLFSENMTVVKRRLKSDAAKSDRFSTLTSPINVIQLPDNNANQELETSRTAIATVSEETVISSMKKKQLKRIIVDDVDEESTSHTEKKVKRLPPRTPTTSEYNAGGIKIPLKSFTTLSSDTVSFYVEMALFLLPSSMVVCHPSPENRYTNEITLTDGPYKVIIYALLTVSWTVQQLVVLIKQKEHVKFLISISLSAAKGCNALIESMYEVLNRCIEWRNNQPILPDDEINTQNIAKDMGSLVCLVILFAWVMEVLQQIEIYLLKFKQFFIDEGTFDIPKSLYKMIPSILSKCIKHIKLVNGLISDHSLDIAEFSKAVRSLLSSGGRDSAEELLLHSCAVVKARKMGEVEADLPSTWSSYCFNDESREQDQGLRTAGVDEESKFEVRRSEARTCGWGLYEDTVNSQS